MSLSVAEDVVLLVAGRDRGFGLAAVVGGVADFDELLDAAGFLVLVAGFLLLADFVDQGLCVRIFCIKNDLGVFSVPRSPLRELLTKRNFSSGILFRLASLGAEEEERLLPNQVMAINIKMVIAATIAILCPT
jgi:hypothetical protein